MPLTRTRVNRSILLNAVYMWTKSINKMVRYLPFDSVISEYFPMADPTTTYSHILLVPFYAFGEYLGDPHIVPNPSFQVTLDLPVP
jgi:hypothetical protein